MKEAIANELRALRARYDKKLEEVAKDIGIDPSTLCRYESGDKYQSVEIIEKLLSYYEEDISIFFTNVSANMHK